VSLIKFIITILYLIFLVGCASMSMPSSTLIDAMSVVTIGETSDIAGDHIVFIPAGTKFPIEFSVKGTVFDEAISSTVMVSFKKNMYLYKYWASLDGKTWMKSHKLMNVEPSGGFDKSGGKVEVKLNFVN